MGSDPCPLLFLGITQLWTPSVLLLQDPIVPAVPLQPPAAKAQEISDTKRVSTFPTCKHSSNSSSLHLESLGKAVLLLLAKG